MKGIFLFLGYTVAIAITITGLLSVVNGLFGLRLGIEGTIAPADAEAGAILTALGISLLLVCVPFGSAALAALLRKNPAASIGYVTLILVLPVIPTAIFYARDNPYRIASDAMFQNKPEKLTSELLSQIPKSKLQHLLAESILHDHAAIVKKIAASLNDISRVEGQLLAGSVLHKGNPEVLQLFIERNADFSSRGLSGGGTLHQLLSGDATEERQLACVELLIQHKLGNVHERDDFGRTPLMVAAERGRATIVKRLLESGARVTDTDQLGNTALHAACDRSFVYPDFSVPGRKNVVALLCKAGADLHKANGAGDTCTSLAERAGLQEILPSTGRNDH